MDRIDNRLRGGTNGARHRVTVIRRHDGGYVSEIAYTDDMLGTVTGRAEPQRAHQGAMKRFFKSAFLTVSGDVNEIG